jgi:hypothetical protein
VAHGITAKRKSRPRATLHLKHSHLAIRAIARFGTASTACVISTAVVIGYDRAEEFPTFALEPHHTMINTSPTDYRVIKQLQMRLGNTRRSQPAFSEGTIDLANLYDALDGDVFNSLPWSTSANLTRENVMKQAANMKDVQGDLSLPGTSEGEAQHPKIFSHPQAGRPITPSLPRRTDLVSVAGHVG